MASRSSRRPGIRAGAEGTVQRAEQRALRQDQAYRSYLQASAGPPANAADQLQKLADLRDRGVMSAEEFEREKAKVLA